MKRKICILLVVLIMIATFATVFTACHGGKYKMQDFVVDFTDFVKTYEVGDQIYFGEMTLFHWSGMVPFEPKEWDYKFGEWLNLPNTGK